MTYEEEGVFMIVFLKGTASADTIMNEAEMSEEETMEGINSLAKKGLLVIKDDGIEYTAAAKKTAEYKLMVEVQAHFQKLLKTEGEQE